MSTIFEALRRAGAVILGGGLLAASAFMPPPVDPWLKFLPVAAQDTAAVHDGTLVLRRGGAPLHGLALCDAVKALVPDLAPHQDYPDFNGPDVIVCFRDGLGFTDALKAANQRGLMWTSGIGGDRIVVMAPSRQRFVDVARQNGIVLSDADMVDWSPQLAGLKGEGRARKDGKYWTIPATAQQMEALFGPYLDLPQGTYQVTLTVQPLDAASCAAMGKEQVSLAVAADARRKILAPVTRLPLAPDSAGGCRHFGSMIFTVPAGGVRSIETPVLVQGPANFRVVGYRIEADRRPAVAP